MNDQNVMGYFAKQVAEDLEITTSTLRRWSLSLEAATYHFEKNDKSQRIYYERDYGTLRELKRLLGNNVPMGDAVNAVIAKFINGENAKKTLSVYGNEVRFSERELEEYTNRVAKEAAERAVAEAWEHIDKAMEIKLQNAVEKQSRLVTQALNNSLEERRLEIASAKEEGKKGFWQRLFDW